MDQYEKDPIIIDRDYVSNKDIVNILEKFRSGIRNFEIHFSNNLKDIDLRLFGYAILLKKFSSETEFEFIFNFEKDEHNDLKEKIYQIISTYRYFYGEEPFDFLIPKMEPEPRSGGIEFVLSSSFLPILFIDKDSYKKLFVDDVKVKSDKIQNSNGYRKLIYKANKELFRNPAEYPLELIPVYAQYAFYKIIDNLNIFDHFLAEEFSIKIQKKKEDSIYNDDIQSIIDDLKCKPPIYHLFFNIITGQEIIREEFKKSNLQKIRDKVKYLWLYTQNLVKGIDELAKNIYQHSSSHFGIITVKMNKGNIIVQRNENNSDFSEFLTKFYFYLQNKFDIEDIASDDKFRFFDINVFDYGESDIIDTLKKQLSDENYKQGMLSIFKDNSNKNMKNISKEKIIQILETDIKNLESFNLKDLIIPGEHFLNQQSIRALAHLGLMIFSRSTLNEHGLISLSSGTLNKPVNKLSIFEENFEKKYEPKIEKFSNTIPYGTHFNTIIPIGRKNYSEYRKHKFVSESQRTPEDYFKNLEKILDLELITLKNSLSNIEGNKIYRFIVKKVFDNEHEPISSIIKTIGIWDYKVVKSGTFVCLDFNEHSFNSSQLFRIIGYWELFYSEIPLIISNIETEMFIELVKINEMYTEILRNSEDIPLWPTSRAIIVYSYQEYKDDRFYFTDALWGKDEYEFYYINNIISKTNDNSLNVLGEIDPSIERKVSTKFPMNSGFFGKYTLLPFDVILPGTDNNKIFYHNAKIILQNKLG